MSGLRSYLGATLVCLAVSLGVLAAARAGQGDRAGVPRGRWVCTLNGAMASPPNGSLAIGTGEIRLRGERIRARFSWRGLSGPALGLHIHSVTATGSDGPVELDIVPGKLPAGTESPIDVEIEIDHARLEALRGGRMYADLHTRIYPDGEIRGPIVRTPED